MSRGILINSRRRSNRLVKLLCAPLLCDLCWVPWVLGRHPVGVKNRSVSSLVTRGPRVTRSGCLLLSTSHGDLSETACPLLPCPLSFRGFILRDLGKPEEEERTRGQCTSRLCPRYCPPSTLAWITFFSPQISHGALHLPQADTVFEALPTVLRQMWIRMRHMPHVPKLMMFLSRTTEECMQCKQASHFYQSSRHKEIFCPVVNFFQFTVIHKTFSQ